jgi:hypothetical protein
MGGRNVAYRRPLAASFSWQLFEIYFAPSLAQKAKESLLYFGEYFEKTVFV